MKITIGFRDMSLTDGALMAMAEALEQKAVGMEIKANRLNNNMKEGALFQVQQLLAVARNIRQQL